RSRSRVRPAPCVTRSPPRELDSGTTGPGARRGRIHADGELTHGDLETEGLLLEDSLHECPVLLELELAPAGPLGFVRSLNRSFYLRDRLTGAVGQGCSKWLHGWPPLTEHRSRSSPIRVGGRSCGTWGRSRVTHSNAPGADEA